MVSTSKKLLLIALLPLAFVWTQPALGSVDSLRQWSLRFEVASSIKKTTAGCYGSSSYNYELPTVQYAKAYRGHLEKFANDRGLSGFIFTSEKDGNRPIVMDLETGDLDTIPAIFNSNEKGIAFCLCRRDTTHFENCNKSKLPPLGAPFVAELAEEAHADSWTDPVTNDEWWFAHSAKNWREAKATCVSEGYRLPDHPTLAHVSQRLYNSQIGRLIVKADSRVVWSSEEFDRFSAMFVYIPEGDAAAGNKRFLHPVVCYKSSVNS